MAIAAGTHQGLVDAEPVRRHVLRLKAAGLSYQRVAQLAGVSRDSVNGLLYGKGGRPRVPRRGDVNAARNILDEGRRTTT